VNHDELIESIPLLAIDALPEAGRDEVHRHVAECSSCKELLADYHRVATALLENVPQLEPPASLADALGQQAIASRMAATPSPARQKVGRLPALPRWVQIGIAAALVLLLAAGALIFIFSRDDNSDDEIAKLVQTPGTLNLSIKGTESAPKSWGKVIANPDSSTAYLLVGDFAKLPPQQVYQVWLQQKSARYSCGLFTVDDKGRATVRLQAPEPIRTYEEVDVTVEPSGGSRWPTSSRIIGGALPQQ
jgi:anti-sigma-K factor RskA